MPRVHIEWRSSSKENYINFCKKNPNIIITFNEWKNIVYQYNEYFKNYILETGEKARLPFGFGEFSINKKKRKKFKNIKGEEYINLPVDWQRSKVKGKRIYNFNYHTEGYFFGWMWFKESARIKNVDLWYFKPSRTTSRLLSHYIQTDNKYQNIYMQWKK
jgi:nucleoid DNA-binding protein|tara:strand:+ start:978 stop:1457 length:480 start_codon:yes stop_codon:yes gene_type:complete